MLHRLYLSLGSNLGDRRALILQALRLLGERVGEVRRVSSLIETQPWGFSSPHPFLNACCLIVTRKSPRRCLTETQRIERLLGRTQKTTPGGPYHDRTIDIDILLYDDLHVAEPDLVIPHPRMAERDFVMHPLQEILSTEV